MKKACLLIVIVGLYCINISAAAGPYYINEVVFSTDATDNLNEYVEIRGPANSTIPAGTYFVGVEGDSGLNPGEIQDRFNLSGMTTGSNGVLVILTNGNIHTTSPGASVVTAPGPLGFQSSFYATANIGFADMEAASVTFFLISSASAPAINADIDSNNDATPDGATFGSWTIMDSVGMLDGNTNDITYGEINYREDGNGTVTPGTAIVEGTFDPAYCARTGDTTGSTIFDWVFADRPQAATPFRANTNLGTVANFVLPVAAEVTPSQLAGVALNHIGGSNANFTVPTAAPGTISGRARTGKGLGIKHAVIMVTGGKLQQPLYATTNQFGYYKFEHLPVGQSYLLQISSGRHTFENSSRLVNLGDSLTNEDFVTTSRVVISSDNRRSKVPKKRIIDKQ